MGCQRAHRWIVQPLTGESRLTGDERSDFRTEATPSAAAHMPDSKPNARQHRGDLRPWKKLLDVNFLAPTPASTNIAKRYDASRQTKSGNVLAVFDQAGPVLAFHELVGNATALTRFGHVEHQQSIGCQGVKRALAHTQQRAEGVISIEEAVEYFAQRRHRSAGGNPKPNERSNVKVGLGNALPSKLDHGRGNVQASHPVTGIGEFSGPDSAAATDVHDEAQVDAVLLQQLQ